VADEIGPSLRWATAEVKKSERKSPGEFGAGPARPVAEEPDSTGYDFGEEPF
jgi:single-strand DNA-binding protein